jgi:hypothetical protein
MLKSMTKRKARQPPRDSEASTVLKAARRRARRVSLVFIESGRRANAV